MTRVIFKKYLTDLNTKFLATNKKILILVNNFSGYKIDNLSNIKLLFLPENTTSVLQPLDLGIISSFKRKYKKLLSRYISNNFIDEDLSMNESIKKVDILVAINWILVAWENVSATTIKNCCYKSKLSICNPCTQIVLYNKNISHATGKKYGNSHHSKKIKAIENFNKANEFLELIGDNNSYIEKVVEFNNNINYPHDTFENLRTLEVRILNILKKEKSKKIKKILDLFSEIYEEKHKNSGILKFLSKK